jgi:uncharacterized protein YndB with AHSA1/START domain
MNMKNFDWTSFSMKILVKAKLSEVYDAWTKVEKIEKWFVSKSVFYDASRNPIDRSASVEKGYRYQWNWFLYDAVENGRFIAANGKDLIQFTFAGDCIVEVKLSEKENGWVLVELSQKDIPADEDSKKEIRLGCYSGWSFYLVNLKSICEGGLDLRNKNILYKPMVNN